MSRTGDPEGLEKDARRLDARVAGGLYVANIVTIWLAIWALRGIVVPRDPAATAANVLAHEAMLRFGLGLELVSTATSVGVAALFYRLFRPVNASASLAAAFFRLAACVAAIVGYLFQFAPLELLAPGHPASALGAEGLQAVAMLLYRLHNMASNIVILLFGFHFILIGPLIYRSAVLPRALGVLVGVAGLGALMVLSPPLYAALFRYFIVIPLLAEVGLATWLLVVGIDAAPWRRREGAHPAG
jgi:hypothetical protein